MKISRTQLSKIIQIGGFLTGLPLTGNVLKPLAKSVIVPLGLIAAPSATDAVIYKKMLESGTTVLVISNEDLNDIMIIVKPLEGYGLLMKGISETVENEVKEQKG